MVIDLDVAEKCEIRCKKIMLGLFLNNGLKLMSLCSYWHYVESMLFLLGQIYS